MNDLSGLGNKFINILKQICSSPQLWKGVQEEVGLVL
jgi:hypothetical protein